MTKRHTSRVSLPPDPLGDALAACYRQLLAQLAQEERERSIAMVGMDSGSGENGTGTSSIVRDIATQHQLGAE